MPQFEYPKLKIESPNVKYLADGHVEALYEYEHVKVIENKATNTIVATPMKTQLTFRTQTKTPKTGMMLVGLGGNNGSTVTAAILANKHKMSFETKDGRVDANYFGSVTQSSTVYIGNELESARDFYVPLKDVVPMVAANDLVVDGWDISGLNLADAMARAKVLDISLQKQLAPYMSQIKPRKALFDAKFVASNQGARADNIMDAKTMSKWQMVEQLQADIEDFKKTNELEKVIVLWTANTERYSEIIDGIHDSAENLIAAVKANESELAPSSLYAIASILSGCTFINGSPQNTFVPGLIELAEQKGVFIAGDDFKSGQTKYKSVIVDFLVGAGIKPCSIVSYNHLGNNDGYNLSAPQQFRSKEISKSSVVDDMVESNKLLFGDTEKLQHPDHCVVIKYVPYVADSKRALDEYVSELMFGGKSTIVSHNTCEDSLLAAPLIIDLVLIAELCERVHFKVHQVGGDVKCEEYQQFNSVLSILAYLCKAPLVERGAKVVNALFKQRSSLENLLRALIALPAVNHMDFEHKLSKPELWTQQPSEVKILQSIKSTQQTPNVEDSLAAPSDKLAELYVSAKQQKAVGY